MRSTNLILIASLLALAACNVKTGYTPPKIQMPNLDLPGPNLKFGLPAEFLTCDTPAKNIGDDTKKTALTVHGSSDFQDLETIDCSGKKTLVPKYNMQTFHADLVIPPPEGLKGKAIFADIDNTRTCTQRRVSTAKKNDAKPGDTGWATSPYWLDDQNEITIGLNNSTIKFSMGLNALPGENLLNITYYDKCLKPGKEAGSCDQGEEIGKKTVLVNVEIERNELNGIKTMDLCAKKK